MPNMPAAEVLPSVAQFIKTISVKYENIGKYPIVSDRENNYSTNR